MKKAIAGINDLTTTNPELMKDWDYIKNADIDPHTVSFGSNKRVWWKCSKCGYEWQTAICNRTAKTNSTGCPACSNKAVFSGHNDLKTQYPDIAKEWDYEKNSFLPTEVVGGSNKTVWWICSKGHSYKERIVERTSGKRNCPYCSGHKVLKGFNDLATVRPEVVKEWSEKNTIQPNEVTEHSNKKVWWKCKKCGHEWLASINTKTRNESGCPVCSHNVIIPGKNDFASEHPELMVEWSEENSVDPKTISSKSGKNVWWECSKCGCLWKATVYSRVGVNSGCPDCAKRLQTSMPEQVIFQYLKMYYPNAINGYKTDWLSQSEIDVFLPDLNCGIEYDGARWHRNARKDEQKSKLIKEHNIRLIRVRENDCPDIRSNDFIIRVNKYDQNINSLKPVVEKIFDILQKELNADIAFNKNTNWDEFTRDFIFDPVGVSLAEANPELIKEWDYEKNGKLKPENVSPNSKRKVWWKCSKCGYSYYSEIYSRNAGTGCPACRGLAVYKGYNDLLTLYPEVAKEWNYDKNIKSPYDYVAHSSKKVWWKCSKCGYEWETAISNRTMKKGTGCPICSRRRSERTNNN